MSEIELLRSIVCHDLDPDFVEAFSIAVGWEYSSLFEALRSDAFLTDSMREEEFSRRRGVCVARALRSVAIRFEVPCKVQRLECNGQSKVLVQAGRIILIQEPVLTLTDHPRVTDYKRKLSEVHGLVRQMELDLGDRPFAVRDWSGCILGVFLHGSSGQRFTREHKALGSLHLAVADAAYSQWVVRLDLKNLALFGRENVAPDAVETPITQTDEVRVTRKRKASKGAA